MVVIARVLFLGDGKDVLYAAADRGDLRLEDAKPQRFEGIDEVRKQVGSVFATQRCSDDELAIFVACGVDGEFVDFGRQRVFFGDLRRLPLQLLHMLDDLR